MKASNNCTFIGRFTKSPFDSLKKLDNGNFFLQVSLAVKTDVLDKDGKSYERVDYPQLTFWNDDAANVARDFARGSLVEVTAQVKTRRYREQNVWRYATDFVVDSIKEVSLPETESPGTSEVQPEPAQAPSNPTKTRRTKAEAV